MTNVNSGDALCVVLITTGLAFPLLTFLKSAKKLGCIGHLTLPALVGSGVIIALSPLSTDTGLIPVSFSGHWQYATVPFNTFVVTAVFSIFFGFPAALGATSLAFCGLVTSVHTHGIWIPYFALSLLGACSGPLSWALLKRQSSSFLTMQPTYVKYGIVSLVSAGLLTIYVVTSRLDTLVAKDFGETFLLMIVTAGTIYGLIVSTKQRTLDRLDLDNFDKISTSFQVSLTAPHIRQNNSPTAPSTHLQEAQLHRTVKHLQEVEDRYRALMETCPDAIVIHVHNTILFANPAAAKLLGQSDQRLLTDTRLSEFIPSDQREQFSQRVQSAMGGEHFARSEERILPLHGSPIDVEISGYPVTFNGVRSIQTMIRDISQRRRTEEALHDYHKRWHTLLESMPEAIMVLDMDNSRIETANPNAQSLFGRVTDQIPLSHKIASLLCKMAQNAEGGHAYGPKILPHADGGSISSDIRITRFSSYGRQKALVFVREAVALPKPSLSPPWGKARRPRSTVPMEPRRYPYIRKNLSSQGAHRPLSRQL